MKRTPKPGEWTIVDALLSLYFWTPILTIVVIGAAIWALFYYIPIHTILWSFAGIVGAVVLLAIGMGFYDNHVQDINRHGK